MKSYFVRVSRSLADIHASLSALSLDCNYFYAVEHEADEDINRTHVHFLMVNYTKSDETLRKSLLSLSDGTLSGNALYSKKLWTGEVKTLVYMLKGNLLFDPVTVKSEPEYETSLGFQGYGEFSDETFEDWLQSLWTDYSSDPKEQLYKEAFDGWTHGCDPDDTWYNENVKKAVHNRAKKVAFKKTNSFWTITTANYCNMLRNTWLMRNGFSAVV